MMVENLYLAKRLSDTFKAGKLIDKLELILEKDFYINQYQGRCLVFELFFMRVTQWLDIQGSTAQYTLPMQYCTYRFRIIEHAVTIHPSIEGAGATRHTARYVTRFVLTGTMVSWMNYTTIPMLCSVHIKL
jgi:hypothetical protein